MRAVLFVVCVLFALGVSSQRIDIDDAGVVDAESVSFSRGRYDGGYDRRNDYYRRRPRPRPRPPPVLSCGLADITRSYQRCTACAQQDLNECLALNRGDTPRSQLCYFQLGDDKEKCSAYFHVPYDKVVY